MLDGSEPPRFSVVRRAFGRIVLRRVSSVECPDGDENGAHAVTSCFGPILVWGDVSRFVSSQAVFSGGVRRRSAIGVSDTRKTLQGVDYARPSPGRNSRR